MPDDDIFPLHKINHKGAIRVSIGNVVLGEPTTTMKDGTQPNPIKITWSRTNDVATHKIPYPKHKTCRTSKESLYTLQLEFKTFRYHDIFKPILDACEACGPHWVKTSTKEMWMYITDYNYTQTAGYDDDYIEWSLSLLEVND